MGVARVLVGLFLIFPYLVFLAKIQMWDLPAWHELGPVLYFTSLQAFLSAVLSVVGGLFIALGLAKRTSPSLEMFVMLPVFLPSLFLVISLMNLIQPFPFGLTGTVLTHVFSLSGLVGIVLFNKLRERAGGMIELAFVEGATRGNILKDLILPLLKSDLRNLLVLVFVITFGSFSIPLLTGKVGAITFEVLTFQKIIIDGNFAQAFGLATLQLLFTATIVLIYSPVTSSRSRRIANLAAIGWWPGFTFGIFLALVAFAGLFLVTPQFSREILSALPGRILGSLIIGLGTGVISFFLLAMICFGMPHRYFERFLNSYVVPSVTLVGFGFLLLGVQSRVFPLLAIMSGIAMTILPGLYRLRLADDLKSLSRQVEVAKTMGASARQIFSNVLFPQCVQGIGALSGYAAFWAVGDFALSRLVADRTISVGMLVDDLLGSYRLASATGLVWLLILMGGALFFLFYSVGKKTAQRAQIPL